MGGLLTGAVEGLGKTLSKDLYEQIGHDLGRDIGDSTVITAKHYLNLTEQGKTIGKMIDATHPVEAKLLDTLDAPRQALWNGLKADPTLGRNLPRYGKMSIGDIHRDLISKGSPLAQHTGKIMAQGDKQTPGRNIAELALDHKKQATLLAQASTMGQNFENVAPLIAELRDHPDPRMRELGQIYADTIDLQFRDTHEMTGYTKKGAVKGKESTTKVSLNKAFTVVNKMRKKGEPSIPLLQTAPIYSERSAFERAIDAVIRGPQAAMAVIPHSAMEFNLQIAAPTRAYVKSLFGSSRADALRTVRASGMLSFHDLDALTDDFNARTGKIAQWTSSPTLGKVLHTAYNMPGLSQLRRMQIRHAGAVGWEAAHDYADKMMKGSKTAENELKLLDIDPNEVRANNGQLTPAQLQKAVYHFADDTMFLRGGSLNMPLRADASFWHRSVNMYHYFVRNQAFFMTRTFNKMLRNGDMAGIARMAGVVAILAPSVAPLIKGLQILTRTGSPKQALKPVQALYAPESGEEWMTAYAESMGEILGIGMAKYYMGSVFNNSWWKTIMGPKISTPVTLAQDLGIGASGKDMPAFARDVTQLVPVVGKPLSHWLWPTKAEQGKKFSPHPRLHMKKKPQGLF